MGHLKFVLFYLFSAFYTFFFQLSDQPLLMTSRVSSYPLPLCPLINTENSFICSFLHSLVQFSLFGHVFGSNWQTYYPLGRLSLPIKHLQVATSTRSTCHHWQTESPGCAFFLNWIYFNLLVKLALERASILDFVQWNFTRTHYYCLNYKSQTVYFNVQMIST